MMRLTKILFLAVFLFLIFTNTISAGTRDPDTPDSKYVEFGRQFPNVIKLRAIRHRRGEQTDKPVYQYGSAVVIRPHWALTAAHVLINTTQPAAIKDGNAHPITLIVCHADFKEDALGYYDLAICYSPRAFDLKFYPPLYRGTDEVGKAATIAGYGLHGTFHTGATQIDEMRRAGHNKIDSVDMGCLICTPSRAGKFPLEFMIAPGDSGGGLFIGNELAGINSYLSASDKKPDGTYTDDAAHTRISLYANWIESQIKQHEFALQARATLGPELGPEISPELSPATTE
jgi:hypothetical protein